MLNIFGHLHTIHVRHVAVGNDDTGSVRLEGFLDRSAPVFRFVVQLRTTICLGLGMIFKWGYTGSRGGCRMEGFSSDWAGTILKFLVSGHQTSHWSTCILIFPMSSLLQTSTEAVRETP